MDRFEKLEARLELRTLDGENVATFAPSATSMPQVGLALSLLLQRLVARVTFECASRQVLQIALDEMLEESTAALAIWQPHAVKVRMSPTEVERWLVFALKYYRDGMGEVDHIDLDAKGRAGGPTAVVVVFKVPNAAAPMTPQQLRARIDKA